jgi:hypothetical protein
LRRSPAKGFSGRPHWQSRSPLPPPERRPFPVSLGLEFSERLDQPAGTARHV